MAIRRYLNASIVLAVLIVTMAWTCAPAGATATYLARSTATLTLMDIMFEDVYGTEVLNVPEAMYSIQMDLLDAFPPDSPFIETTGDADATNTLQQSSFLDLGDPFPLPHGLNLPLMNGAFTDGIAHTPNGRAETLLETSAILTISPDTYFMPDVLDSIDFANLTTILYFQYEYEMFVSVDEFNTGVNAAGAMAFADLIIQTEGHFYPSDPSISDMISAATSSGEGTDAEGAGSSPFLFEIRLTSGQSVTITMENDVEGFAEVTTPPGPDPIPEPATIALLGIGLAGLAGAEVRRRRKKKA